MQDKFVWVDVRWQDAFWLSAFRMRLCGWLPSGHATTAIASGIFVRTFTNESDLVELTFRARRLTDIDKRKGDSSHNCLMLANVLVEKGFDSNWLQQPIQGRATFLRANQVFPKTFRSQILREIASLGR